MSRSAAVQAAVVAVLVGVMFVLLASGGADRHRSVPQHRTTYRPATEQERQQAQADQLATLLDEMARHRALLEAVETYRGL